MTQNPITNLKRETNNANTPRRDCGIIFEVQKHGEHEEMETIGLIGGMSFESSAVYYRIVNEMVRDRRGGLASAELILHSVNFEEIVALQKARRLGYGCPSPRRRGSAPADRLRVSCILICTNTMHLIADKVAEKISVPLIHIIDETAKSLHAVYRKRPLLLATRYTMEHGFYSDRMKSLGIDIMVPDAGDRTTVHDIIFNELCA